MDLASFYWVPRNIAGLLEKGNPYGDSGLTSVSGRTKPTKALSRPAIITSDLPNHGKPMVRFYGVYSNPSRRLRQREKPEALIPPTVLAGLGGASPCLLPHMKA
jgi:hypothetical protein